MFGMSEEQLKQKKKDKENAIARGRRFLKNLVEALRRNGQNADLVKGEYYGDAFEIIQIGEDKIPISMILDRSGTGFRSHYNGKLRLRHYLDGKRAKSHPEPKDGFKADDWIGRILNWLKVEQVRKQQYNERQKRLDAYRNVASELLKQYPKAPISFDDRGIKIQLDRLSKKQAEEILEFLSEYM